MHLSVVIFFLSICQVASLRTPCTEPRHYEAHQQVIHDCAAILGTAELLSTCHAWSMLNCFQTQCRLVNLVATLMWPSQRSVWIECGLQQTVNYIVNTCLINRIWRQGSWQSLHEVEDNVHNWLRDLTNVLALVGWNEMNCLLYNDICIITRSICKQCWPLSLLLQVPVETSIDLIDWYHHHLFAKNTNTTNEVHEEQLKQVWQGWNTALIAALKEEEKKLRA